jgi:DNA-directed RNA polymerase beta' subunit
MGGRVGLIDTAVKTADSGYIQRKLVKLLEDVTIAYDGTVRGANGHVIQFLYGDDGINPVRLERQKLNIIGKSDSEISEIYGFTKEELATMASWKNDNSNNLYGIKSTPTYIKDVNEAFINKMLEYRDVLREHFYKIHTDEMKLVDNLYQLPFNLYRLINTKTLRKRDGKIKKTDLHPSYILQVLNSLIKDVRLNVTCMKKSDRENKKMIKHRVETHSKIMVEILLYSYLAPKRCIMEYMLTKEEFNTVIGKIRVLYQKSIAQPGAMVGIFAAQSLGEPSTQMSCSGDTVVMIKEKGRMYYGRFDEFVDRIIRDNPFQTADLGNNSAETRVENDCYIMGVSKDSKGSWKRISHVSRHPANGDLINVKTASGREVKATLSHSFLRNSEEGIVPIRGSDLSVGDEIPVSRYIPVCENSLEFINVEGQEVALDNELGEIIGIYLAGGFVNQEGDICFADISTERLTQLCQKKGIQMGVFEVSIVDDVFRNIIARGVVSFMFEAKLSFIRGLLSGYVGSLGTISNGKVYIDKVDDRVVLLLSYCGIRVDIIGKQMVIASDDVLVLNGVISVKRDGDIFWDEIVDIELIPDPKEYVYDFTVPGNETFMVNNGIYVHNTLNTFHLAGVSSKGVGSLGIPRLKELLRLSENMLQPIMKIHIKEDSRNNIDIVNKIKTYIHEIYLRDLIDDDKIDIYLDIDREIQKKDGVSLSYHVDDNSRKKGKNESTEYLPWVIRMELDKEKMFNKGITLLDIKTKYHNYWQAKQKEVIMKRDEKEIFDKITKTVIMINYDNSEVPIVHIRLHMNPFNYQALIDFQSLIIDKLKLRGIKNIEDIDEEEVPLISYGENGENIADGKEYVLYTSGSNLMDLRILKGIDLNRTVSNNVREVYEVFGIEAVRNLLIKEYDLIFKEYDIDYHHLSVLVDVMCQKIGKNNAPLSIDRYGMNKMDIDPLARASFERTTEHLFNAGVFGEVDHLTSVSSRIMTGKLIRSGTGACDVLIDNQILEESQSIYNVDDDALVDEIIPNQMMKDIISKKSKNIWIPQ